jgi:hypothetical protein
MYKGAVARAKGGYQSSRIMATSTSTVIGAIARVTLCSPNFQLKFIVFTSSCVKDALRAPLITVSGTILDLGTYGVIQVQKCDAKRPYRECTSHFVASDRDA